MIKHAHVDETLLFGAHGAERASALGAHAADRGPGGSLCSRDAAHPFALAEPDADPFDGPTRLACLWDGNEFVEFDALGAIKAARRAAARLAIEGGFGP